MLPGIANTVPDRVERVLGPSQLHNLGRPVASWEDGLNPLQDSHLQRREPVLHAPPPYPRAERILRPLVLLLVWSSKRSYGIRFFHYSTMTPLLPGVLLNPYTPTRKVRSSNSIPYDGRDKQVMYVSVRQRCVSHHQLQCPSTRCEHWRTDFRSVNAQC